MSDATAEPAGPAPIGWAFVDLLGHRHEAGFLSEQDVAGVRFLKLATPVYNEEGERQPDDVVVLYSTNAVYSIRPTTWEAVEAEVRPWRTCLVPVSWPDGKGDFCRLRRGHEGDHNPDDGLPF